MKDPMLATYTLPELAYEYYNKIERRAAAEEAVELEDDKIEEDKEKAALAWAEEEDRKEQGLLGQAQNKSDIKETDEQWMDRKLEEDKKLYGESFGEDLNLTF